MNLLGSELCKYAYTKTEMKAIVSMREVRSYTNNTYTKMIEQGQINPEKVQSRAKAHIPKHMIYIICQNGGFGAALKYIYNIYTKTRENILLLDEGSELCNNTYTKIYASGYILCR